MGSGAVAYVRQHERLGLGHAVWCARQLIGNEPFAVMLPDDIIDAETPCLQQMVEAYAEFGGSMVATMEVPRAQVSSYGIVDVEGPVGPAMRVRSMVEKPPVDAAPSNHAIIGRYILTPSVLGHLNKMKQGAGGEIQLTDAIAMEIERGGSVHAYRFRGRRYDCGSKAGYLQATVAFGLAREDLREEFLAFLQGVTAPALVGDMPIQRLVARG
jgi:UTP--glucose-1-phosphate uridylyltransferase